VAIAADHAVGWRALCLRLAVLTLPAQVLGAFVGGLPTLILGARVLDAPWVPSLVLVGMGGVTGLAVGLLAHPPRDRWRSAVALAAGFGLAGFVILRILVQVRLPPGSPTTVLPWLIGPVVVLLVQSILVALLWRRRTQR